MESFKLEAMEMNRELDACLEEMSDLDVNMVDDIEAHTQEDQLKVEQVN